MAIVLFDGSMPSVKALEAGCANNFFCSHAQDQLVVLHATKQQQQSSPTAMNATSQSETGGGGRAGSVSAGGGSGAGGSASAAAASADADAGGASGGSSGPNIAALPMVIELVQKNRFANNSLNYKLETFRLAGISAAEKEQILLAAAQQQQQNASSEHQNPTTAPQQPPAPSAKIPSPPKGGAAAAAAAAEREKQEAAAREQQQQQQKNQQQQQLLTVTENFAEAVAARAQHHNIRTVLLGVGSSGGHGKALVLGGFARAVIDRFITTTTNSSSKKSSNNKNDSSSSVDVVGIMKPSGPPVRATQPMRVVVVVTPHTPHAVIASALQKLPHLSASRGDFVGLLCVMNDGKAKPQTLVNALKTIEAQRQQQLALGQLQQTPMPTSQEQLGLINFEQESAAFVAQQEAKGGGGGGDGGQQQEEDPGKYWKHIIDLANTAATDLSKLGFLNQDERIAQMNAEMNDNTTQQQNNDENGSENGGPPGSGRSGATAAAGAGSPAAVAPTILSATTTAAGFEGPHLMSAFWIEPTARDHSPALESNTGSAQLAKACGALKTDYVLLDSRVMQESPNAMASLLSATRPHVLLT